MYSTMCYSTVKMNRAAHQHFVLNFLVEDKEEDRVCKSYLLCGYEGYLCHVCIKLKPQIRLKICKVEEDVEDIFIIYSMRGIDVEASPSLEHDGRFKHPQEVIQPPAVMFITEPQYMKPPDNMDADKLYTPFTPLICYPTVNSDISNRNAFRRTLRERVLGAIGGGTNRYPQLSEINWNVNNIFEEMQSKGVGGMIP